MPPLSTKSNIDVHSETYSRRQFLKKTVAGLTVLAPMGKVLGANEDIRVGIIGLGNKGKGHVSQFMNMPGVRVVALCDVDPERLAKQVKRFDTVFSQTDPRRIIDRKDIEVVVISAPDHWHALLAIWACQSGKDVYVEKPVSHNIWEGRKIIEAATKYGRIVQSGTQYRSDEGLREAAHYIHSGHLGKMLWGHVLWYERRGSIGKVAPYTPDWLDYDMYCGPAPVKLLRRKKLHYDWHWIWSTGTGDLGNSGIHAFDVCRWFADYKKLPPRAVCVGGRFGVEDAGETPNTQFTILDYEPAPIYIENRNLPMRKGVREMDHQRGIREGVILQCERGYFAGFRGGGWVYDNDGGKIRQFKGDGGSQHAANFIQAVRNRNAGTLNAPIQEGHISSAVCHLGNLSYRMGTPTNSEGISQAMHGFKGAEQIVQRLRHHLLANEVNLKKTPMSLGPCLTIDLAKETITTVTSPKESMNIAEANRLVRGSYRAPFIVPETV
jgi:predicted dehydrogenase